MGKLTTGVKLTKFEQNRKTKDFGIKESTSGGRYTPSNDPTSRQFQVTPSQVYCMSRKEFAKS